VDSKKILVVASPKGYSFPPCVLYVDDVFVFCKANKNTLDHLMKFLHL